jgi:hypothetical protein
VSRVSFTAYDHTWRGHIALGLRAFELKQRQDHPNPI